MAWFFRQIQSLLCLLVMQSVATPSDGFAHNTCHLSSQAKPLDYTGTALNYRQTTSCCYILLMRSAFYFFSCKLHLSSVVSGRWLCHVVFLQVRLQAIACRTTASVRPPSTQHRHRRVTSLPLHRTNREVPTCSQEP